MAKPTIEVFDENAVDKLVRMYEDNLRRIQVLEQREAAIMPSVQVQPIIGKATGAAGTVTGTYKINVYHGPFRNGANNADGEFAAYLAEAKPWAGTAAPSANDEVMLWQTPFGQWYFMIAGAGDNFWFQCKFTGGDLGSGYVFTPDVSGGTYWAGTSDYPVYYSGGVILIARAGCWLWRVDFEVNNTVGSWTQPADNRHHWARMTITGDIAGGSAGGASMPLQMVWPAIRSDSTGAHTHSGAVASDGAHTHTFVGPALGTASGSLSGFVERADDTPVVFSIDAGTFSASTSGPAFTDFLLTGTLTIHPIDGA